MHIFFTPAFALSGMVAVGVLSACTGPYDPAGLSKTLAESQCQFAFDCCSAPERNALGYTAVGNSAYSTKEECLAETTLALRVLFNVLAEAQAEGRIEWDAAAAEECYKVAKTAANECNAEEYQTVNCDLSSYATGKVAGGEACYNTFECAEDGAVCEIKQSVDEDVVLLTFAGKCVSPLKIGEDCSAGNTGCAPELYCSEQDAKCTAYLSVGADCSEGRCDPSIGYCDSIVISDQKCATYKEVGITCLQSEECRSKHCDLSNNTCTDSEPDEVVSTVYEICTGEVL